MDKQFAAFLIFLFAVITIPYFVVTFVTFDPLFLFHWQPMQRGLYLIFNLIFTAMIASIVVN